MTSSVRYPTPPPTFNTLDTFQRQRIMKSTRKLGKLLGTTPYLSEERGQPATVSYAGARTLSPVSRPSMESEKSIRSSRRLGSIFSHSQAAPISAASSVTSLALPFSPSSSSSSLDLPTSARKFTSRRSEDTRRLRPLVLHLNPVSVPPTDPRVTYLLNDPHTDKFSPATPVFDLDFEDREFEARRRKMSKIQRTLGENVPAELVFPPTIQSPVSTTTATADPKTSRSHKRKSASVSSVWSTGLTGAGWVGEWNRNNIGDVQKQLRGLKSR